MQKKDAIFLHAKKRLKERYNQELTEELHEEMIEKINMKRKLGLKHSCRNYVVNFILRKKKYYIIFDRKRNQVVTFLTKEMYLDRMNL